MSSSNWNSPSCKWGIPSTRAQASDVHSPWKPILTQQRLKLLLIPSLDGTCSLKLFPGVCVPYQQTHSWPRSCLYPGLLSLQSNLVYCSSGLVTPGSRNRHGMACSYQLFTDYVILRRGFINLVSSMYFLSLVSFLSFSGSYKLSPSLQEWISLLEEIDK